MNHPKREEWIPYLYGEANTQTQRELKRHLNTCPECQAELASWQQSLCRLDAWKLPRARGSGFLVRPLLQWSLAGACLLMLGFIAGTLNSAKSDRENIRARIEPQLRQELKTELAGVIQAEVNTAAETTLARAAEQNTKAIAAYAATLEAKHTQDYQDLHAALLVLKEQLDTVAMNTDAGFRQAERKLVALADYKQPTKSSIQP